MVRLKVLSSNYNCDLLLERRITYIRGDSGTGKTGLIVAINDYNSGDSSVKVICDRDLEVINNISSEVLRGYNHSVIFIDDSVTTEYKRFGNNLSKILLEQDLYLVINRVDIDADTSFSGLDCNILVCRKDGNTHYFDKLPDIYENTCDFIKENYL